MINQEMLNKVLRSLFVAKINLPEDLPQELVDLELFPNTNDCFLIHEETCNRMEVAFRKPKEVDLTYMKPSCGSKLIGSFRDKGSITGIMKRYIPVVAYSVNNKIEAERLISALKQMRGENTFFRFDEKHMQVLFPVDIIANPSTERDNVSALILQSCIEIEGILEDTIKEYTLEEIVNMNVEEVIKRRKHEHQVFMLDVMDNSIVYDFGEVPILLEDFFWQPKHDNSLYCQEKEFSCNYHQFIDGLQTIIPEVYNSMINSLDYEAIHEYALLLGMKYSEDNYSNHLLEKQEKVYKQTIEEEDIL